MPLLRAHLGREMVAGARVASGVAGADCGRE